MNNIQQHLTEYRKQLESAQRQVVALTGAIQALERLQKDHTDDTDAQRDE